MRKKNKINIHIIGAGEIGKALAKQMVNDGCSVTVVDTDGKILETLSTRLDVFTFQGNGASYTTLMEVNAGDADIFIAVTDSDELNILSCLTAHLLGAKHTVARVRDVDYARQSAFYRNHLGLSLTINPELAAAREISRLLRFPYATRVEIFAKGRAELVEMTLPTTSPLCGKTLIEITQGMGLNLLICAVARGEEVFIPKGQSTLAAGDILYLTGAPNAFHKAFKQLDMPTTPVHTALIAGAGRVAHYLTELLHHEGVNVTVVERSRDLAVEFCRNVPECSVMNDDAITYFDSMSDADITHTDAFISLTENDEFNMVAAMYAKSLNIRKVIARLGADSKLKGIQKGDALRVVSHENAAVDWIMGYVRSLMNAEAKDAVESLYLLMDGKIEFIEFRVTEKNAHLRKPLREWHMRPDTLIACIIRGNKTIMPRGDDVILPGDSVLIATINQQIIQLEDVFESTWEAGVRV